MNKKREKNNQDDDIVMYILVNNNLNMSRGKLASQVAHSACNVVSYLVKNPTAIYREWLRTGSAKIVLKSDFNQMEPLTYLFNNRSKEIWCDYILDQGRTQVEPGSLTTIAFNPMRKSQAPDFIQKMKLL